MINMPTLMIFKGLPGSGKTTAAKELIAADPTIVRVNKDDLRLELLACAACGVKNVDHEAQQHNFQSGWSEANEKNVILPERDRRITEALKAGKTVICDDTNLAGNHITHLTQLAQHHKAEVQLREFTTSLEECIARDARRTGLSHVGEQVIRRMYNQHIKSEPEIIPYQHQDGLPWALISDLDGTAADYRGIRNVFDEEKCHLDRPVEEVKLLLRAFSGTGDRIVYMSGRTDKVFEKTRQFLQDHAFPDGELFMRKNGDRRNDSIVKQELFDTHVRGRYNVRFVVDDRPRIIRYWRNIGLFTFTVGDLKEF